MRIELFAAAAGALVGSWTVAAADRWCPRAVTGWGRLGSAGVLAVVWGAVAACPYPPAEAQEWWIRAGFAILGVLGVLLARVDWAVFRLPDLLVLPGYLLVGVPLYLGHPTAAGRALAASTTCLLGYGLLCALGGLGFGDVKLGGLLGLALGWLSWQAVAVAVTAAVVIGAVHAVIVVLAGRGGRSTPVPYGPAMLAGAFVALLAA